MQSTIDAYARWVTSQGKWAGPTTTFPDTRPRPRALPITLRSALAPLAVHASEQTGLARAQRALAALEHAHALSFEHGWPLPYPDGGLGGGPELDLYLLDDLPRDALAAADQPIHWAAQDATASHAMVDARVPVARLEACVLSAFLQAALLGQDPAEPEVFRRASALYAQWQLLGAAGCEAERADGLQRPEAGLFDSSTASEAATAWLLSEIASRHDGASGRLLRELWQLARQRSESLARLRASPNLLEAIALALRNAGETFDDAVVDFASARARSAESPRTIEARPYLKLPQHLPVHEPGLRPYGSAYIRIDMTGAKPGERLDVWLRGENGVRWSLVAQRRDRYGRGLGSVAAPPRKVPRAFIPLELDDRTAEVWLIVTALPAEPATLPTHEHAHHFRLILDRKAGQ